jgi:hypothetical protein
VRHLVLILPALAGLPLGCGCSEDPEAAPLDAAAPDATDTTPNGGSGGTAPKPDGSQADAATGGAPDAAPDASPLDGSGVDPAYAWLFDDAAWKPLSTVPGCDLREADLAKVQYPGHAWTDCGTGCNRTVVMPGSGVLVRGARRYGTGARPHGGDIQVFMTGAVRFPPAVQLAESFGLGTDVPASLIAVYGDACELAFLGGTSTRMFRTSKSDPDGTHWFGLAALSPGDPIIWPVPAFASAAYWIFDFAGGWGAIVGKTSVEMTLDPTTTKLESVYSSPAYQLDGRAHGDTAIWADWSGKNALVRVWTPAGGTRVLAQGPWDAANLAISDTRVVWMGATGPLTLQGSYETARLYWSQRKLDPDQIAIQQGPTLPPDVSSVFMATHGRWVALERYSKQGAGAILVADLDASTIWSIPVENGQVTTVLAISDTEVLLAEGPSTQYQIFDALVRYELAKLTDYATKLP